MLSCLKSKAPWTRSKEADKSTSDIVSDLRQR